MTRTKVSTRARVLVLGAVGAMFAVTIAPPAFAEVPANDDFASAVAITALPFSTVAFSNEATKAPDDPDCFSGGRTLWYSFARASDVRVDVNTFQSNYDTTLGIYAGVRGSLTQVACNDDAFGIKQSSARFDATGGTTYYVMIGSLAQGTHGTLKLNLSEAPGPPANDKVSNATSIDSVPFQVTEDVREATTATDDGDCFGDSQTVWFKFVAPNDRRVTVSTYGSNFAATLAIYQVKRGVTSSIDCQQGYGVDVSFDPQPDATYSIRVGAVTAGAAGTLRLSVFNPPLPVNVHVSISSIGKVSSVTGVALVRGVVRCSHPGKVSISGAVRQRHKSRVADGEFRRSIKCDGKKKWHALVDGGNRAFFGGPAGVRVSAYPSTKGRSDDRSALVRLEACACKWGT